MKTITAATIACSESFIPVHTSEVHQDHNGSIAKFRLAGVLVRASAWVEWFRLFGRPDTRPRFPKRDSFRIALGLEGLHWTWSPGVQR